MQIGLARGLGGERVDDNHPARCLGQPMLVAMRSRRRRIGTPHKDATGIDGAARIKTVLRRAVQISERDVTGLVANRVRIDLACTEGAHEAHPERVAKQRERARVVRVENRTWILRGDLTKSSRDHGDRLLPTGGTPSAHALGAVTQQRFGQPGVRIQEHAVIAGGALATELAAADRMATVTTHVPDRPVTHRDLDPARVITITRTRREDRRIHRHIRRLPAHLNCPKTTHRRFKRDLRRRASRHPGRFRSRPAIETDNALKPSGEQPARKGEALALVATDGGEQRRQPVIAEQPVQTLRIRRDLSPLARQGDVNLEMELNPIGPLVTKRLLFVSTGPSQLYRPGG